MSSAREKDQLDFDLERSIEMFDTALTSKDERVVNALRSLLMIVALTNPEDANASKVSVGPLRAMERDLNTMNSRIRSLESEMRQIVEALNRSNIASSKYGSDKSYMWPDRSEFNSWSQSASNVYMNDYLKKLNGGSV